MRKFIVNVNGNKYEVEVEEVVLTGQPAEPPAVTAQPAAAEPSPAVPEAPAAAASSVTAEKAPAQATDAASHSADITVPAGAAQMTAPMPGTILDIKVKQGDKVKKGDVLMILEAMKMENEIVSPQDGIVATVNITKGSSVNSGDLLLSING